MALSFFRENYRASNEGVMYMSKKLTKTQIEEQRLCYAVKACYMMGFDVEKTADLLETETEIVSVIYAMIERDMIDFNSK